MFGTFIPASSISRSWLSSASVQRRPAGRGPVICPSPSALGVLASNRPLAAQLSATGISRFLEKCRGGRVPEEPCERSLAASPPFLPALAVSSPCLSLGVPSNHTVVRNLAPLRARSQLKIQQIREAFCQMA